MPKKRHSAFEDFPVEDNQQPAPPSSLFEKPNRESPAHSVQEQIADGFQRPAPGRQSQGYQVLPTPSAPQVERIERLHPSQMLPDRFQPRRLLPTSLRQSFYSGKIDCYEAARQWLEMAEADPAIREQVDGLLAMGGSFEEHGQIKPITGSWTEASGGRYVFQIETGERRYWAACLQSAIQNLTQEPSLRVEVIEKPTRARQVIENQHAEAPTAVGQACEVAALILAEMGITPGQEQDEFDYFRQAVTRRKSETIWDKITPIMRVSRPRLFQILGILELPTPLLELADRHRIPERILREIRGASQHQWESLLHAVLKDNLTADEVALRAEKPRPAAPKTERTPPDPAMQAINSFKRFTALTTELDEIDRNAVLDEIANDLVLANQGETALILLRDLSERIRIRQQNRMRRR